MCLMHLSVPVNRFGRKLQMSNKNSHVKKHLCNFLGCKQKCSAECLSSRLSQNNSSTKIEGESVIMAACNLSRMLECNIINIFCFHIYIYLMFLICFPSVRFVYTIVYFN